MLKRTITAVVAIAIFIPVCVFSDTFVWPAAFAPTMTLSFGPGSKRSSS